jgi:tetratricopeptide (TPR) repeat protein
MARTRDSKSYPIFGAGPSVPTRGLCGCLVFFLAVLSATPARAYDKREGQAFHDAYLACEALARDNNDEGRFDRARACLIPLSASAKEAKTRAEIEYRRAELQERGGHFDSARESFLIVARRFPREDMGARARFRAARLCEDRLDKPGLADQEYRLLVREAPDSTAALNALVHIEERVRASGGTPALISFYENELSARPRSTLASVLLDRLGHASLEQPAHASHAVRAFDVLASQGGAKVDDALYFGAKARVLTNDLKGAIAGLEKLLDSRERTPIPGSLVPGNLHSSRLDDARFLLAEIMRDNVKDDARAKFHFETLLNESPDSRLYDDALKALADLAIQGGDRPLAARYYARLVEKRPASRYKRLAMEFRP